MSRPRIGIDLTESPLRVGGRQEDSYIVKDGSKGLKLRGPGASVTNKEMTAILIDAAGVVRSFSYAAEFEAAIIVIPNGTWIKFEVDILTYGRETGFEIPQVIKEHSAVSAAYVEKVKPNISTNLTIVSLKGGMLEISVVSIEPVEGEDAGYHYTLLANESLREEIDLKESKDEGSGSGIIGLIGGAAKTLVVEPSEEVLGSLNFLLDGPKFMMIKVDKVVFVGKASRSAKLRKAVTEFFSSAEVWEGIDNPDEIVAYGAAYLCSEYKEIQMDRDNPNVNPIF